MSALPYDPNSDWWASALLHGATSEQSIYYGSPLWPDVVLLKKTIASSNQTKMVMTYRDAKDYKRELDELQCNAISPFLGAILRDGGQPLGIRVAIPRSHVSDNLNGGASTASKAPAHDEPLILCKKDWTNRSNGPGCQVPNLILPVFDKDVRYSRYDPKPVDLSPDYCNRFDTTKQLAGFLFNRNYPAGQRAAVKLPDNTFFQPGFFPMSTRETQFIPAILISAFDARNLRIHVINAKSPTTQGAALSRYHQQQQQERQREQQQYRNHHQQQQQQQQQQFPHSRSGHNSRPTSSSRLQPDSSQPRAQQSSSQPSGASNTYQIKVSREPTEDGRGLPTFFYKDGNSYVKITRLQAGYNWSSLISMVDEPDGYVRSNVRLNLSTD